jgi:hypothetical protein
LAVIAAGYGTRSGLLLVVVVLMMMAACGGVSTAAEYDSQGLHWLLPTATPG